MTGVLVFAYGSNMCRARLARRVRDPRAAFVACLPGHDLRFHKRSYDRSGKADAFRTGNPADAVWGVVYEVDEEQKTRLDWVEGVGRGYVEEEVTVVRTDGEPHVVRTYVADPAYIIPDLQPYAWYLRYVVAGAIAHGLPHAYVARLRQVPAGEDFDDDRNRQELVDEC